MKIRIEAHTLKRAEERGTEEAEIRDVMRNMESGGESMQISYDAKTDLLYLRLDDEKQNVVNRRVTDDIVLDIDAEDRIVGIEILDASRHVRMNKVLPVEYPVQSRKREPATVHEKPRRRYKAV